MSTAVPLNPADQWKQLFKQPCNMDTRGTKFLIQNLLDEGITILGGLSGHGKTWFALSLAKALHSGQKFLNHFTVLESVPIVYLIPEVGESPFGGRLKTMRMSEISDGFFIRTMKSGPPISLVNALLLECVRDIKPVVFLDTAIRFSDAENENDARQNAKGLAQGAFDLMSCGARAVIGLHHSPKILSKSTKNGNVKKPTLESGLRGSGDFGAMSNNVYILQCEDKDTFKVRVTCVKAREFAEPSPFEIQGRPYLDETGDFRLISELEPSLGSTDVERLNAYLSLYPEATHRQIADTLHVSTKTLPALAQQAGWTRQGKRWTRLT